MAYNYLLELHELIDIRMTSAKEEKTSAQGEDRVLDAAFHDGHISILAEMAAFWPKNSTPSCPERFAKI